MVFANVHKEMKGGNSSRLGGWYFCFTVAALVFSTLFFWSLENNRLLVNHQSSSEETFIVKTPGTCYRLGIHQSMFLISDLLVDGSADSSLFLNTKKQLKVEDLVSQEAEVKNYGKTIKHDARAIGRANLLYTENKEKNRVTATSLHKQACDYAKGRWVATSRSPLYSGFGCKNWLSDMWACRLTQRPDFSYEGYRWQPDNCEIPVFRGAEFLRKMQDKTVAFVGDSLGRQQFQSLMCMISGGEVMPNVKDVGAKYGFVKPEAVRPDGWAFWFPDTNTTILYYWSASLCDIEPINATGPAAEYAMHLDQPPSFLRHFLPQFDVLILNTGHHWNRGKLRANRWVMYANGNPVTDRKLSALGNAKNYTIYSITRWVDSQISLHPHLKVFFRTISPRHFAHGEWNTGGNCDNLIPLTTGNQVLQNGSSDPVAEGAVRGKRVKLLDITALSKLRDEAHISRYSIKASGSVNDCLHWCLPGIPDTWNEMLYAHL